MPHDETRLITRARDLSKNNTELVAAARRFAADPPSDDAALGFYGAEEQPDEVRAYYALVTALDAAGYLYAVEDKYTPELFAQWVEGEVIVRQELPPAARGLVEAMLADDAIDMDEEGLTALFVQLFGSYGQATHELEAYLAAKGQALLSLDPTLGDTMFFALVDAATAQRWANRGFGVGDDDYCVGPRRPMWDRLWFHLCYALGFDDLGAFDERLPADTREAPNTLAMALDCGSGN